MSVNSVGAALLVKIITNTGVIDSGDVFGDYFSRRQSIPADEWWMSGDAQVVGVDRRDAQISYLIVVYRYIFVYHLPDPITWDASQMQADQTWLMDPLNWIVSGVYEVYDNPELELITRTGNVMEYGVSVQLSINP